MCKNNWLRAKHLSCLQGLVYGKSEAAKRLIFEARSVGDTESVKHLESFRQTGSMFYVESFLRYHSLENATGFLKTVRVGAL